MTRAELMERIALAVEDKDAGEHSIAVNAVFIVGGKRL